MILKQIKHQITNGDFYLSNHADKERQNDNLLIDEIVESINNGIILESYEDTGRGEAY